MMTSVVREINEKLDTYKGLAGLRMQKAIAPPEITPHKTTDVHFPKQCTEGNKSPVFEVNTDSTNALIDIMSAQSNQTSVNDTEVREKGLHAEQPQMSILPSVTLVQDEAPGMSQYDTESNGEAPESLKITSDESISSNDSGLGHDSTHIPCGVVDSQNTAGNETVRQRKRMSIRHISEDESSDKLPCASFNWNCKWTYPAKFVMLGMITILCGIFALQQVVPLTGDTCAGKNHQVTDLSEDLTHVGRDAEIRVVQSEHIVDLADEVRDWKKLGRYLKVDDTQINMIADQMDTKHEHCYQMLVHWKQKNGEDATIEVLSQALERLGRRDLVTKLLK